MTEEEAEGERVWARSYYRNATGAPLRAVLTLMGPGGRAVQVHCGLPAADAPGTCETPHQEAARGAEEAEGVEHAGREEQEGSEGQEEEEKEDREGQRKRAAEEPGNGPGKGWGAAKRKQTPYSAVAEIASVDGDRLLLRAGSNSPQS